MRRTSHSWAPLGFAEEQAVFKGPTQNVRALSEGWVATHMFFPACGAERLRALPNNSPLGDFVCDACAEEFELKAKKGALGRSIPDGAYGAMTARLAARNNPSLFAMSYDQDRITVRFRVFARSGGEVAVHLRDFGETNRDIPTHENGPCAARSGRRRSM